MTSNCNTIYGCVSRISVTNACNKKLNDFMFAKLQDKPYYFFYLKGNQYIKIQCIDSDYILKEKEYNGIR